VLATNDHMDRSAAQRSDRITRSSRVALLAQQIAAGEYHPDPEKLAEVILRRAAVHRRVRDTLLEDRERHVGA
jgi:anti-sigma28 factor (negative regulator of flagellin synthesis)